LMHREFGYFFCRLVNVNAFFAHKQNIDPVDALEKWKVVVI
jgi:hypothetical protein